MSQTYHVNECFYSLQGEGARAGTANVFLRFAFCNLQCVDLKKLGRPLQGTEVDAGFNCDTDFAKGEKMTLERVVSLVRDTDEGRCKWVILTGGEPTLQADAPLLKALRVAGYKIAIETNGTRMIDGHGLIDWVSCSPKRGSKVALLSASEVRVVVEPGQEPNAHGISAVHYFVSPACLAPTADKMERWESGPRDFVQEAISWATDWCLKHPRWRVSLQTHKILGLR